MGTPAYGTRAPLLLTCCRPAHRDWAACGGARRSRRSSARSRPWRPSSPLRRDPNLVRPPQRPPQALPTPADAQRRRLPADLVPRLGAEPRSTTSPTPHSASTPSPRSSRRPPAAVGQQFPGELADAFSAEPDAGTAAVDLLRADGVRARPPAAPSSADDDVTDVANPAFLPDFDHNGVYGDPGDFVAMEQGPGRPRARQPEHPPGHRRLPLPVHRRQRRRHLRDNDRRPARPPARRARPTGPGWPSRRPIIDARGLRSGRHPVAPRRGARRPATAAAHAFPAVVISDGHRLRPERLLLAGHDARRPGRHRPHLRPGRPGRLGGQRGQPVLALRRRAASFGGACRDLEDVVRWLLDDPITPSRRPRPSTPIVLTLTTDATPPSARGRRRRQSGPAQPRPTRPPAHNVDRPRPRADRPSHASPWSATPWVR